MLKNYIATALRNFLKNKTHTLINISGLAVGITCCVLILTYVQQQLQFDTFHTNSDRIYRLGSDLEVSGNVIASGHSPGPTGPALEHDYPGIEHTVRFLKPWSGDPVIKRDDKVFSENGILYADPSLFKVFSFDVLNGNPREALQAPGKVVLTEAMAEKYFGRQNALGQTLTMDGTTELIVSAVIKDVPDNSHIKFDFLVSMATMQAAFPPLFDMWNSTLFNTYIMLKDNTDPLKVDSQLPQFTERYIKQSQNRMSFALEPLADIYLFSDRSSNIGPAGDIMYVYIFTAVALFILLIACINFMNLSTARSSKRAVEIGVRKVLGADRRRIILQFLVESVITSFFALLLAIVLIIFLAPVFSNIASTEIHINFIDNQLLFLQILAITLFIGLAAGSYPALVMSRFGTATIFREHKSSIASGHSWLRKTLVVLQFTISVTLIVCTLVVYTQLDFILGKDLGFSKEQLITIPVGSGFDQSRYQAFRQTLLADKNIQNVSASLNLPGMGTFGFDYRIEGRPADEVSNFSSYLVDAHFLDTYQIELLAGRAFSKEFSTDASQAVIINEAALKHFGWQGDALNKQIDWLQPSGQGYTTLRQGKVIGVVKDFHASNLHLPIGPVILQQWESGQFNVISVKLSSEEAHETMDFIQDTWASFTNDGLFNPAFLHEQFASAYQSEAQFGTIFSWFAGLAIIIACLGLYGLASFMAEQRTKEIGIRKVHGAAVAHIIHLLSKEFVRLVVVANLIAWPLAWFSMESWLQDFAYRIDLSWWLFALSGSLALLIALLSVSYQALKAATANPIESLRYE